MHSILILDDEEHILKSLIRQLRSEDYSIDCFTDPEEALKQCTLQEYDLVLSDQRMPQMEGTRFFYQLAQIYPATRRVLISGYADFGSVTEAFNDGLIHKFVVKPWSNDLLIHLINEQLKIRDKGEVAPLSPNTLLPSKAAVKESSSDSYHGIVTQDLALKQQIGVIKKTASSEAPVFIHGETGTGKEMIARAIHLESNRSEHAFVALNCANLTETLLESQLFGHAKGAFTSADSDQKGLLAEAEGGTLFMDEVTEIPIPLQAKLLRVLQEREYTPVGKTKAIPFDVKVISASSTSLEKAVEEDKFREDLRYRLEVIPITLPPLRARMKDKRMLFDLFLSNQLERHGCEDLPVEENVYACIDNYDWPGNVRELVNVCTYVAALRDSDDKSIGIESLPQVVRNSTIAPDNNLSKNEVGEPRGDGNKGHSTSALRSRAITKERLQQAMEDFHGHRDSIARHFGVSRMTLWRKIKQFNLVES